VSLRAKDLIASAFMGEIAAPHFGSALRKLIYFQSLVLQRNVGEKITKKRKA
jgi:hypothetical protein